MPIISVFVGQKQEDCCEFKASLGHTVKSKELTQIKGSQQTGAPSPPGGVLYLEQLWRRGIIREQIEGP